MEHPIKAFGWAATDLFGVLSPFHFSRRATGDIDVQIRIFYCGICHSDLHCAKNEWSSTKYPLVPGHEIVKTMMVDGAEEHRKSQEEDQGSGSFLREIQI